MSHAALATTALARFSLWCLRHAREPWALVDRLGAWLDLVREVRRAPHGVAALVRLRRSPKRTHLCSPKRTHLADRNFDRDRDRYPGSEPPAEHPFAVARTDLPPRAQAVSRPPQAPAKRGGA